MKRQLEANARIKFVSHGLLCDARTMVINNTGMSKITKNAKLGRYEYRPTPVLMLFSIKGPIILVMTSPKMDFRRWVCKMLVELMPFVIEQNTVLSLIPICSLKITSKIIPKINKTALITIEIFKYLVVSISFLITWDKINNKPKIPKNIMSLPLEDPIKNKYVAGLIMGFKMSVMKITPASNMNMIPISIVLLTFINNNLIIILYKSDVMFPIEYFIGLILIGVCAGFASGLLGVGGGFLIVPLQYFLLKYIGVEPNLAILISFGTSLAIIIPTSLSGAYRHTQSMDNIINPGIKLGIFGIIGGVLGGFVASGLSSGVLEIIFGCLLLFITINNIVNINKEREAARIPFNLLSSAIIGILVGFSSGLLGVGGGIFLIAILTALLGFSMIEAIGTSSIFICLTAIGGFLSYMVSGWGVNTFPYSIGYVSIINFLLIAAFSVPLASIGAKYAHRVPQKKLKVIFSILVFYMALKMLGVLP